MSFRETSAWITLISITLCFGVYYGALLTGLVSIRTWGPLHLGIGCIVALVALQAGLNLAVAIRNPKEARTPRDERERLIDARSHTIGYYVMMVGMAVALVFTHLPIHGGEVRGIIIDTVNFGIGVMVVAALTVAIAQIVMFRRGA
ncbi:MAG: hypothetical protein GC155_12250 [Alphaproteobacteria bacterium]|nr:hypothetical protein [Alphaproteobacteria bacterium]